MSFVCFPQKDTLTLLEHKSDSEKFLDLQQAYTNKLERAILNILEPLVGRNKVRVAIQLDLDLKDAHVKKYNYGKGTQQESASLQQQIITHSLEKQIQNKIQQQHISVVVDGNTRAGDKGIYQPRTQKEMDDYRRLIENAVGYNSLRGDTLEILNIPFVYTKSPHKKSFILMVDIVLSILAILLILFGLLGCFQHCAKNTSQKSSSFSQEMLTEIIQNPSRIIAVVRNWIYMPATKKNDWLPIQKVGIILLALDEDVVKKVLIALDDDEVRQVAKAMTTLGVIPPQESTRILTELHEAMFSGSAVVGNPERVQQILSQSTSKENLNDSSLQKHKSLWQDLNKVRPETLASRLENVKAETIAYILYQLPTSKVSDVIQYFQENKATQVLIHLSHIGHLSDKTDQKMHQEALEIAEQILRTLHTLSGSEKTSEILSQIANTSMGHTVLHDIQEKDPQLARKLTSHLIHFDDIKNWSDKDVQTLLKHTLRTTALEALVRSSIEVKNTIQRNIPSQVWAQLEKEIQAKEKEISSEQVLKAQQIIVETARTLLQQGKIDI